MKVTVSRESRLDGVHRVSGGAWRDPGLVRESLAYLTSWAGTERVETGRDRRPAASPAGHAPLYGLAIR